MMLCRQLMTEDVVCCVQSDTAHDAALRMMDFGIGAVAIVDSAETMQLVGIITDRDLVLRMMAAGKQARDTALLEIMSKDVAVCHQNDNIESSKRKIERLEK